MKTSHIIIVLSTIVVFSSCKDKACETPVSVINTVHAQKKSDTIFLKREKGHDIFIDSNKNSENYKTLNNFDEFPKVFKKDKLQIVGLPAKWIPLYSYKQNYYLYRPCDLGCNYRVGLSNSQITFEGFELNSYKINSKIQQINNYYKLAYSSYEGKSTNLEIHIVDKPKGLAVFSYNLHNQLMVDANKLSQFPIIVNECQLNKTAEFEFDDIDFKKLLKPTN